MNFEFSLPHDELCSVLLLLDDTQDIAFQLRCDPSAEAVYIEFDKYMIESTRRFDVFESCWSNCRLLNLPTWVPNWSAMGNLTPFQDYN